MPGTRDGAAPLKWFEDVFGFRESTYQETRDKFEFAGGVLLCKDTSKLYQVGSFDVLTLEKLHSKLDDAILKAHGSYFSCGSLTFENIVGDTHALHVEPTNAHAVFQASSLFNCLETLDGGTPETGVTKCAEHESQGAACAIACPAATVFRNYFANGTGQGDGNQVDCLDEVATFVDNSKEGYWIMRNGMCLPKVQESIGKFSQKIAQEKEFADQVLSRMKVGVHWETEVGQGLHSVSQVFCSALPVGTMKKVKVADWSAFAKLVLEAAFEATLCVAAIRAAERGTRIPVYVTAVGGGPFGNRRAWIAEALEKALARHAKEPLEVMLVHYSSMPESNSEFFRLEEGRLPVDQHSDAMTRTITRKQFDYGVTAHLASLGLTKPTGELDDRIKSTFQLYDLNGDGEIDRKEFMQLLKSMDSAFFTDNVIKLLLKEADADGNGTIHYSEFVAWLFQEDEEIRDKVLVK